MSAKRVLVADDQAHVIRVVKLKLEHSGYAVDTAKNGLEALEKLRRDRYDVLITDMEMPRMDGQALCNAMHAELTDGVPLTLIVTGKTDEPLRQWASSLPNTRFLEKPLSLRSLTTYLSEYFTAA
jgi:CheY-like chemotaxis protein